MGLVRLTRRGEKILVIKQQITGMGKGELLEFAIINMPMVRLDNVRRKER